MRAIVLCEESQTVCKELRKLGVEAYSCDLLPCSGGCPEWHLQQDALSLLSYSWDLIIAHPPCTYLTVTGNKWMKPEFKDRFPDRASQRQQAIEFFMSFVNCDCKHVAIENPVGIMSTVYRKPDQYIQPYQFGEPHSKKTGLWLKGLPTLKPTKIVTPKFYTYKDGRRDPIWHVETMKLSPKERAKERSKTFPGIAKAMAEQWVTYIKNQAK